MPNRDGDQLTDVQNRYESRQLSFNVFHSGYRASGEIYADLKTCDFWTEKYLVMNTEKPNDSKRDMRKYPRKACSARTVLFHELQAEVSETLQVGEGGMMVTTKLPVQIGEIITIHFVLNENYIRARGKVLYRIEDSHNEKVKLGIEFQSLFEEYREAIRNFSTI